MMETHAVLGLKGFPSKFYEIDHKLSDRFTWKENSQEEIKISLEKLIFVVSLFSWFFIWLEISI